MLNEIFSSAQNQSKRYERKFIIPGLNLAKVRSLIKLHPACFKQVYPRRTVNNIYLDSLDMRSYHDNLLGLGRRAKVRIRWYGGDFKKAENPVLEIKTKENLLGGKFHYPLGNFGLNKNLNKILPEVIKKSEVPEIIKPHLSDLRVSSVNSYSREYYISGDKKVRLTVDYDLRFYNQNIKMVGKDASNVILELKYDMENANKAGFISNRLPCRVAKNSKYVAGVKKNFLFL